MLRQYFLPSSFTFPPSPTLLRLPSFAYPPPLLQIPPHIPILAYFNEFVTDTTCFDMTV